jgi:hypothetical protein
MCCFEREETGQLSGPFVLSAAARKWNQMASSNSKIAQKYGTHAQSECFFFLQTCPKRLSGRYEFSFLLPRSKVMQGFKCTEFHTNNTTLRRSLKRGPFSANLT